MTHHAVTSNALTAALIFIAVGMLLTRTVGMAVRATHFAPNRPINAPAAMNAPWIDLNWTFGLTVGGMTQGGGRTKMKSVPGASMDGPGSFCERRWFHRAR